VDGIHDMGGMDGFGPMVPVTRIEGLGAGMFRAAIEAMPPDEYLAATYYERWMYGVERRLRQGGVLTHEEVDAAVERFAEAPMPQRSDPEQAERVVGAQRKGAPMPAAAAPQFRPGQRVRVRRMRPPGHTRCPRYVRGACGVIERVHGDAVLPDAVAQGEDRPPEALYAVRFRSDDLFGPGEEPPFRVLVDLSESYLEEPPDA
jgi:nitrile hydratase beta subunit